MSIVQKIKETLNAYKRLSRIRKLENAVIISSLFFVFKVSTPFSPDSLFGVINEVFLFLVLLSWGFYAIEVVHEKASQPMPLVLNSGILIIFVYFLSTLAPEIFSKASVSNPNLAEKLLFLLLNFVFLAAFVMVFTVLRELFFLKQKKSPQFYFDVMFWTLVTIFFVRTLISLNVPIQPFFEALYVVVTILFAINSIRVAWIAFLTKREKLLLLLVSIILSVFFSLIYSLTSSSEGVLNIALKNFSPGFQVLFHLLMLYGSISFGVIFFTTLFHLPTAAAFEKKAEEVTSLTNFTNLITSTLDFQELAEYLIKHTLQLTGADVAWLYVNRDGKFVVEASENLSKKEADKLTAQILEEFGSKIPQSLTNLTQKVFEVQQNDAVKKLNFETLILAPLRIHNEINGCLFIGAFNYSSLDADDRKTIKAFADYSAVALENSLLIQESIEKERLEKELDIARDIQHKIIPTKLPQFQNLEISVSFIPAFEVGGDYYDFATNGKEEIKFFIADVSGKGISAAFIMAELKGIFESLSRTIHMPKEMLIRMNELLDESLSKKEFITALGGTLNVETGEVKLARAGHTPALLVHNGKVTQLLPAGIGFGFNKKEIFDKTLEETRIKLEKGDLLFLFTDGLTDAQNKYLDFYGLERVEKILLENQTKSTEEISEIIMKEVTLFSKDVQQRDDITFLILKWMKEK